jgi:hypothetical protein
MPPCSMADAKKLLAFFLRRRAEVSLAHIRGGYDAFLLQLEGSMVVDVIADILLVGQNLPERWNVSMGGRHLS